MKKLVLIISVMALGILTVIGCSQKNKRPDQTAVSASISPSVMTEITAGETDNQNILREIVLTDTAAVTGDYEINLFDKYKQSISNEPELEETDIIEAINKWFFDIYPYGSLKANAFGLASLMDPYTFEWAKEVKDGLDKESNTDDKINYIRKWMSDNLAHTQMFFTGVPGNDPWGIRDDNPEYPAFKAETPSEMKALSIYSGKNTGKCNSLALTNADIMLLLGVSPDDIVQFILNQGGQTHVLSFVKFEGNNIYFDNTGLVKLGQDGLLFSKKVTGVFNYSTNQTKEFELTGKFYNDNETLIQSVFNAAGISKEALSNRVDILYQFKDRKDLVSKILTNEEGSELFALTKYSYQSLYVEKPELYLVASMRTSGPKDLADELKSPEEIFNWIKTNISTGSIFKDSEERIMTADEVIACKTGSLKDQAVLAFTLLKHIGFDPVIDICKDNAYITFDNNIYEIKSWKQVQSITGEVLLQLHY